MEIEKENALNIILHYGLKHQIRKFAEESYELVEALLCEQMDSGHVAEEIADCCVMIEQFKQLFCFSDAEIVEIANSKIKRQIERIKANKDEKDDYSIRNNRNM